MNEGNVPEVSEVKPHESVFAGILAQDLQLVEQVESTAEPDKNKLEHLAGREIEGAAFRSRRQVEDQRQRVEETGGDFLKLKPLKSVPRFLNDSDVLEALVVVEPVVVLVDEDIQGGDFDVQKLLQLRKALLQVLRGLDAMH